MANRITYADKEQGQASSFPANQTWASTDADDVKVTVNAHADDIEALEAAAADPLADPVDRIDLAPTTDGQQSHLEGRTFYDTNKKSLIYMNEDSDERVNVGGDTVTRVVNQTGSAIVAGTPVIESGTILSGFIGIKPAQADNVVDSKVIGVVSREILDGSFGYIKSSGVIEGVNTSTFSVGDNLYLSPTIAGGITNVEPLISTKLGVVITSSASGSYQCIIQANAVSSTIRRVNNSNIGTVFNDVSSSVLYLIEEDVDFGSVNIEVPVGGIFLSGYNLDLSYIRSSEDNYTLFTSESPVIGSGNVYIQDLTIEISGSNSKVYDIYDATGFNALELARVNYNNCTNLGDVYDYRQGLEIGTGRFGGSPSLTLHGLWRGGFRISTSIVRGLAGTMTEPLFKEGTLFQMNSRFLTDINVDLPTLAPLLDFQPINFPNSGTLQLKGCEVTRDGAYSSADTNITPNISSSDLPSYWKGNNGIPNTYVGGTALVVLEAITNIAVSGDYYPINATWLGNDLQHFELVPSGGGLKHTGTTPREFEVTASLNIDGGANDELSVKVFKWDDSASSEIELDYTLQRRPVNNFQGGRDVAFFIVSTGVELDTNDIMYWRVSNDTDVTDVTLEGLSFIRIQER